MATIKITEFPNGGDLETNDQVWAVRGGNTDVIVNVPIPTGDNYTPSITIIDGAVEVTGLLSSYQIMGNSVKVQSVFTVTSDDTYNLIKLRLDVPVTNEFSNSNQARIEGLPSIVPVAAITPTPKAGNTGCGWNNQLFAVNGDSFILFYFEVSEIAKQYQVNVSWTYDLQA